MFAVESGAMIPNKHVNIAPKIPEIVIPILDRIPVNPAPVKPRIGGAIKAVSPPAPTTPAPTTPTMPSIHNIGIARITARFAPIAKLYPQTTVVVATISTSSSS